MVFRSNSLHQGQSIIPNLLNSQNMEECTMNENKYVSFLPMELFPQMRDRSILCKQEMSLLKDDFWHQPGDMFMIPTFNPHLLTLIHFGQYTAICTQWALKSRAYCVQIAAILPEEIQFQSNPGESPIMRVHQAILGQGLESFCCLQTVNQFWNGVPSILHGAICTQTDDYLLKDFLFLLTDLLVDSF